MSLPRLVSLGKQCQFSRSSWQSWRKQGYVKVCDLKLLATGALLSLSFQERAAGTKALAPAASEGRGARSEVHRVEVDRATAPPGGWILRPMDLSGCWGESCGLPASEYSLLEMDHCPHFHWAVCSIPGLLQGFLRDQGLSLMLLARVLLIVFVNLTVSRFQYL